MNLYIAVSLHNSFINGIVRNVRNITGIKGSGVSNILDKYCHFLERGFSTRILILDSTLVAEQYRNIHVTFKNANDFLFQNNARSFIHKLNSLKLEIAGSKLISPEEDDDTNRKYGVLKVNHKIFKNTPLKPPEREDQPKREDQLASQYANLLVKKSAKTSKIFILPCNETNAIPNQNELHLKIPDTDKIRDLKEYPILNRFECSSGVSNSKEEGLHISTFVVRYNEDKIQNKKRYKENRKNIIIDDLTADVETNLEYEDKIQEKEDKIQNKKRYKENREKRIIDDLIADVGTNLERAISKTISDSSNNKIIKFIKMDNDHFT